MEARSVGKSQGWVISGEPLQGTRKGVQGFLEAC
jgi:hypothetical protein